MNAEQRKTISDVLQHYGAHLTDNGFIALGDKVLGVWVDVRKARLRMRSRNNDTLASYPIANIAAGVSDFVERFWYWKASAP